jgi:cell division protein FtsI (penicillin-binding protein 3)
MSRNGINFSNSPLLASKTPPWRSRFVVAMVALGFAVLFGRAVWLQILHTDFYQAQGEKRFVVTQPLPASRGEVLDRINYSDGNFASWAGATRPWRRLKKLCA